MPKKYTDDVKKRTVELVLHAQSNPDTSYGAITRIAAQFDVKADTLRIWIRMHESTGQCLGVPSRGVFGSSIAVMYRALNRAFTRP